MPTDKCCTISPMSERWKRLVSCTSPRGPTSWADSTCLQDNQYTHRGNSTSNNSICGTIDSPSNAIAILWCFKQKIYLNNAVSLPWRLKSSTRKRKITFMRLSLKSLQHLSNSPFLSFNKWVLSFSTGAKFLGINKTVTHFLLLHSANPSKHVRNGFSLQPQWILFFCLSF